MRGTMKDQKNYTLFFTLNTHILDKSMVQKSLIFPMARVSQVFLMIAFICFPRLSSIDPDSVNLGWGPEIYFMKYPSPKSPYLKGRWSYTVTGLRPFPATRPLYFLFPLPVLYLPLLFAGPAPPHPSDLSFYILFSKGSSMTTLFTEIFSP